jgi:benzil reductase ((S)-benzoin forming)
MKTLLIITGHTKGIGKAILDKYLCSDEIQVTAISRSWLKVKNSRVRECVLDFSELDDLEDMLPACLPVGNFDRYLLILNAGTIGEVKPIGKLSPRGIQETMNVNLLAPMILTDAFVKAYGHLPGQKLICMISSGAAHKPLAGWGEYCASKSGLEMFAKVIREELKEQGIRVFSVAPGIVDTDMQAKIRSAKLEDFPALKRFKSYKTEQLLSSPAEVAEKIFYMIANAEEFEEVVQDVREFK